MILHDVMLSYDDKQNAYYVYVCAENKRVKIEGDMDRYRAISLFEKAVEKIKGNGGMMS